MGKRLPFYAQSKRLGLALELLREYNTRSELCLCDKEEQTNVRGYSF
jgi:hypothetical protein